ncbi:MAG: dephospho-CoA kinase [Snowella sp.]|jgi:dephospho-CoA kinase|nr:MAG: dephospho-CoA kinase [Snowella sp.]
MNQCLIGLTGGIATGKTTVSNYLRDRYGFPILDADIYAKEAVEVDSPIFQEIVKRYGSEIQLENRALNRTKLGDIIFNDHEEKKWLEAQIHPYVRKRFQEVIDSLDNQIIVLSIPLLIEANLTHLVSEIWVVFCHYDQQIQRLQQRNYLTEQQAIARIKNQLPLTEKITRADVVLDNSGGLDFLYQQIDQIVKKRIQP